MPKRSVVFFLCFFLLKCNNPEINTLSPVGELTESNSGIFFSRIRHIQEYDGYFYFNDYENNRILRADSSLNLVDAFGKTGRGPGEFQGVGPFFIYNNLLYIYDDGGMRINVLTFNGKHKETLSLSSHMGRVRFTILNNKIYIPPLNDSGIDILIMNLKGNVLEEIETDKKKYTRFNYRLLLNFEDQIISVNRASPFIQRFSDSGKLLEVFDLTSINALQKLWNYYNKNRKLNNSNSTNIIFEDAYINGSFVYVLCAPWPTRDNYSYIIKLSLDKNKIEHKSVFKIQGTDSMMRLFKSLAVEGDKLIVAEAYSGKVFEFELPSTK